jgi:hypothetical protein
MTQPSKHHFMAIDPLFEARLDADLGAMACFAHAAEERHAPLLPEAFVLAGNYIKSFPQHAFAVSNTIRTREKYLLSPTCCYPVFHARIGARIAQNTLVTHKNLCFRCEEYYQSGTRQIAFMMREYIRFSPNLDDLAPWIEAVKSEVAAYIGGLGLPVEVEVATDPFFNANDYKQKFQKDQNLKSEFVVNGIAVASINLHLRAFAKACDIAGDDGEPVYTACFGMGYDRLHEQFVRMQSAGAASARKELSHV